MKRTAIHTLLAVILLCIPGLLLAQLPTPGVPSVPLNIDLGVFGGLSSPLSPLSNSVNSGWNAGAKARLSGFLPVNILISGAYNRLPFAGGVIPLGGGPATNLSGESMTAITAGAGLEYPLTSLVVKPYLAADGFVTILSSTVAGATSTTREGAAFGAGVMFSVPAFGSFDLSVKYQMLNAFGKDSGEDTQSLLGVSLAVMFGVL